VNAKTRAIVTPKLIELRHRGKSWRHCAEQLGQPVDELRELSVQLRDAGRWRINGQPARNASVAGLTGAAIGRPRVDSVGVNVRLPSDIARALREVAEQNDMRLGEVVSEAMVSTTFADDASLTFGKLAPRVVQCGPPKQNVNVRVSTAVFNEFTTRHGQSQAIGSLVAAACEQLLRDLGCELVKS
jgi:hypothetical protein